MTIPERLVAIREKNGYTRKRLAEELGRPYRTLTNYETGDREPGHEYIIEIAKKFGVTTDYILGTSDTPEPTQKKAPSLSDEAMKLADDYENRMDDRGRETVRAVADFEIARKKAQEQREQMEAAEDITYFIVPYFLQPASAGTGDENLDDLAEDLELAKRPPRGTSYVVRVDGNSMEPTYQDGDRLFVRACNEIAIGKIGIFFMDGKQWVKELGDGELISHNPDYPPRTMTEDVRCQGLVLGVCDESYFE